MIHKIEGFLHRILDKLIKTTIKRELSQYEIEKMKFIFCLIIGVIGTIGVCTYFVVTDGKLTVFDVYGSFSLFCLPLTMLYAISILGFAFKGGTTKASSFGLVSSYLSGNIILLAIGIVIDIILYCLIIFLAILIGLPIAILNGFNKINSLKNV